MIVESRAVAPFMKNGYVVASAASPDAVIIDPGDEVADLIALTAARGWLVRHILLTHGHMDHVAGVEAARAATGAKVGLHRDDLFLYESAREQGRLFGFDVRTPAAPDFFLSPGDRLSWRGFSADVLHTPGHSPGGICFHVRSDDGAPDCLFVGDTLFNRSIGRTDLPGGDYQTLMASITRVLMPFPDSTVVYSGHGPETTIGNERRRNPFLQGSP